MTDTSLQHEIDQLKGVSTRLDALADQHPRMQDAIVTIAGNVLNSALLLQVLLAMRRGPA